MRMGIGLAVAFLSFVGVSAAPDVHASMRKAIDIAAQSLGTALQILAKERGFQIVYDADEVNALRTRGARGDLTSEEALTQLLLGTGLTYRVYGNEAVGIVRISHDQPTPLSSAGLLRVAQVTGAEPGAVDASRVGVAETEVPADSGRAQLEEVVVSAQRRDEKLQNVPISVQVLDGDALAARNTTTLTDLSLSVPSFRVEANAARSNSIHVRGIGSGDGQSFDQSVGVFIDEIYYGRSRFTTATFLDLERLEVLKGPQSSFFGNNAIAGALNIVTKKPGDHYEATARALYGEYGTYALEGAMGGPISDIFGARVAFIAAGQDGWLTNLATGRDEVDEKNVTGRLTLAFNPTEDFESTLKIEIGDSETSSGLPNDLINCPRPEVPFGPTGDVGINGNCALAEASGAPSGIDDNKISLNPGSSDFSPEAYVLHANYHHWDHDFSSVTGYQQYEYSIDLDADLLPLELVSARFPERYRQFSQELRVSSPTGGTFEYMVGAYYQKSRLHFDQEISIFVVGPFLDEFPPGQQISFTQDEENYSVFSSLTWNATDALRLTAGLRGTWVEKAYDYAFVWGSATQPYGGIVPYSGDLCTEDAPATGLQAIAGDAFQTPPCAFSGKRKDDRWYPAFNIQYEFDPRVMAYLRFDKSFKAGGINGTDSTGSAASLQYEPEQVEAYEAGLKSYWFDNSVLLNLAVFRMDYRDLQVLVGSQDSTTGNILSSVKNAAASRSQGVELEAQWVVSDSFRLSSSVTYLDARYRDYQGASQTFLRTFCGENPGNTYCNERFPQGVGIGEDRSGMQMDKAPKWSGTLTGTFSQPVGNYTFIAELNGFYSSSWYRNILDEWTGAYGKLDGRLSLQSSDERWTFDLIGQNLADRDLYAANGDGLYAVKQRPRTFSAQVRYQF